MCSRNGKNFLPIWVGRERNNLSVQTLYNLMPYPVKTLLVSAKGFSIASWRYGPETERLVAEAFERETWGGGRWQAWQQERLAFLLERAATRVPYYRDYWQKRRAGGDKVSWEVLANWPILDKETLRATPKAFLADDCNPGHMQHWQTSGSSGTPVHIWWSRDSMRSWYALFEARWRRWHGVSMKDRWAILGGKLIVPVGQKKPPFWVWNGPMNQLYMSAYHLSSQNIPAYLDALSRQNIVYLYGYSSALFALAHGVLESGVKPPQFKVILTNAEPLLAHQRELIMKAFSCPVRETYGMAEAVAAAGECTEGQMHLWPEAGLLEFVDKGHAVEPGQSGEIVATGLANPDVPLIRYRVGDRGVKPQQNSCSCGRNLPILPGIEGRCDDVVLTRDGRQVGRLDPVFKATLAIRGAQIVQHDFDNFTVKVIPDPAFTEKDSREIIARLRERVGSIDVKVELVDSIPVGANGKFKAVVSHVAKLNRN